MMAALSLVMSTAATADAATKLCLPRKVVQAVPENPKFLVRNDDLEGFYARTDDGHDLPVRIDSRGALTSWVAVEAPAGTRFVSTGFTVGVSRCNKKIEFVAVANWQRPAAAPRVRGVEASSFEEEVEFAIDWQLPGHQGPVRAEWAYSTDDLRGGYTGVEFLEVAYGLWGNRPLRIGPPVGAPLVFYRLAPVHPDGTIGPNTEGWILHDGGNRAHHGQLPLPAEHLEVASCAGRAPAPIPTRTRFDYGRFPYQRLIATDDQGRELAITTEWDPFHWSARVAADEGTRFHLSYLPRRPDCSGSERWVPTVDRSDDCPLRLAEPDTAWSLPTWAFLYLDPGPVRPRHAQVDWALSRTALESGHHHTFIAGGRIEMSQERGDDPERMIGDFTELHLRVTPLWEEGVKGGAPWVGTLLLNPETQTIELHPNEATARRLARPQCAGERRIPSTLAPTEPVSHPERDSATAAGAQPSDRSARPRWHLLALTGLTVCLGMSLLLGRHRISRAIRRLTAR
jgi:hypothetical protein